MIFPARKLTRSVLLGLLWSASGSLAAAAGGSEPSVRRGLVYARPSEGIELRADVHRPKRADPAPAVLVVHGGSWTRGSRSRMDRVSERLARSGYVAVNIDYRLAPDFRFPAQIHDCKEAVRWIRRHASELGVDPSRVGGFGYSAGAHLVALLATTRPEDGLEGQAKDPAPSTRIQAAVVGGLPSDLRAFPPNPTVRRLLGGSREEVPRLYDLASPIRFVSRDDPPLFLYHGRNDWIVDVSHSRSMAEALERNGVPHELREPSFGHAATFFFDGAEMKGAIDFLDRWLAAES
ncbi:MAG: alpha/beta hydrolase [Myxococcota bacterium]|nr:alpha/beta hydrolase [Myxococcota bacterium]